MSGEQPQRRLPHRQTIARNILDAAGRDWWDAPPEVREAALAQAGAELARLRQDGAL